MLQSPLGSHAQNPGHISCVDPFNGPCCVPGRHVVVPEQMPQIGVFVQSLQLLECIAQYAFAFEQYAPRGSQFAPLHVPSCEAPTPGMQRPPAEHHPQP
jgi:hypothetical protein